MTRRRSRLPGAPHPASMGHPKRFRVTTSSTAVRLVADTAAIVLSIIGHTLALPGHALVWLARGLHERWGG